MAGRFVGMHFQVTVRYGTRRQRYHTYVVEAEHAAAALQAASERMPPEISGEADLVELRVAVDPEERPYVGE
ncbi:MAG: hypothetical protein PVH96_03865 [Gemmatimonadota bacterium]|jgi:hypothetical protein